MIFRPSLHESRKNIPGAHTRHLTKHLLIYDCGMREVFGQLGVYSRRGIIFCNIAKYISKILIFPYFRKNWKCGEQMKMAANRLKRCAINMAFAPLQAFVISQICRDPRPIAMFYQTNKRESLVPVGGL